MSTIDFAIIIAYLAALVIVGFTRRAGKEESAASFILGGRRLTLPAFVATLVSSWYGGILGVGEYSFRFGVSNWLVFGLPYYLAAFLFALFLAGKARQAEVLTIPDRLDAVYGRKTAVAGSIILFLTTIPGAYVLMLAVLARFLFGWPLWLGAGLGVIFSLFYVHLGGFRSVVRTDLIQFGLMFCGFIVLFILLVTKYGGYDFIASALPETHLTWHGGNSGWYIASWYFIALATLIEPAFYQRCYAAKNKGIARNGIFVSIALWACFDFLTTSCGLYARVLLPDLADPISSYPALAVHVLPVGLMGLFALSLIATVMSTIDSYSFLAASTFGRDIIWRLFKIPNKEITHYTRIGLFLSGVIALILALYFESVIDIWHDFGSVATPALLVPLFSAFIGTRRMPPGVALTCILISGGISLLWLLSENWTADSGYWLGIGPIFPGLAASLVFYILGGRRQKAIVN
ncbi:MAG: sodium:solute symporter family protein [Candidatus Zixiibacteriota bacterium]|nr:MAG: sodium:solute symporter family protein [candidate division Zixibacteria bacterium]